MSQPKRYSIRGFSAAMVEEENGVMVRWEDYAALQAETVRKLEETIPPVEAYIIKLEADNERLRKAGDAMAGVLGLPINKTQETALNEAWLAAKEVQS
jgi:hypothetical protein